MELQHQRTVQDRLAAEPDVLFVYGTLQFPEVLQALLGRIPRSTPAIARAWRAAALDRRVYPGLVEAEQDANGLLLDDLSAKEWRALDSFEDDKYALREIHLVGGAHGWAYIWPGIDVLPENWDPTRFRTDHLTAYAARCGALTARRVSPAS
ncbi:gamma-glutamylcyclotransferase family protein [Streptomyces sp. NPDC051018]|uniref:gamma-glutamylcyclotransferase family protein n=1 Tax=Streptomyces sp. NPDC051018 TaxID=3365639 RepID=UPI00379C8372